MKNKKKSCRPNQSRSSWNCFKMNTAPAVEHTQNAVTMQSFPEIEPFPGTNGSRPVRSRPVFWLVCLFLAAIFVPVFVPARADIYRYIDSEGVVHFTNTPTETGYEIYIREQSVFQGRFSDPDTYDDIIRRAENRYGVSFALIKAVIRVESAFNPRAVSVKGARGLMQIMPENDATLFLADPFDPSQNIMAGTRYLKQLLDRYQHKLPLALAAYNAGPGAVDRYRHIPPFRETRAYVQKVMDLYSRYKGA
jgi:soluble lytic murein transglycosylase-like protein